MVSNRAAAVLAGLALALVLAAAWAVLRPPAAPPPGPGDCEIVAVTRRALHTEIVIPASAFGPQSPLKAIYPEAQSYSIGWGDATAFPGGLTVWTSIRALAWPTASVLHLVRLDRAPGEGGDAVALAVSREGLDRLAREIEAAFALDAAGDPAVTGPGRLAGRSVFVRAGPRYHLFRTCNVWTADRLRAAGSLRSGAAVGEAGAMRIYAKGFELDDSAQPDGSQSRDGQEMAQAGFRGCLLYTSPSPRDRQKSRMPSSA